jgi:hypothetical protein
MSIVSREAGPAFMDTGPVISKVTPPSRRRTECGWRRACSRRRGRVVDPGVGRHLAESAIFWRAGLGLPAAIGVVDRGGSAWHVPATVSSPTFSVTEVAEILESLLRSAALAWSIGARAAPVRRHRVFSTHASPGASSARLIPKSLNAVDGNSSSVRSPSQVTRPGLPSEA